MGLINSILQYHECDGLSHKTKGSFNILLANKALLDVSVQEKYTNNAMCFRSLHIRLTKVLAIQVSTQLKFTDLNRILLVQLEVLNKCHMKFCSWGEPEFWFLLIPPPTPQKKEGLASDFGPVTNIKDFFCSYGYRDHVAKVTEILCLWVILLQNNRDELKVQRQMLTLKRSTPEASVTTCKVITRVYYNLNINIILISPDVACFQCNIAIPL